MHTEEDDLFTIGLWERIGGSLGRENDNRPMNRGSRPVAVCVPPEGSFFGRKYNLISEVGSRRDGALRNVLGPIKPRISGLLNTVPATSVNHPRDDYYYYLLLLVSYDYGTEKNRFESQVLSRRLVVL